RITAFCSRRQMDRPVNKMRITRFLIWIASSRLEFPESHTSHAGLPLRHYGTPDLCKAPKDSKVFEPSLEWSLLQVVPTSKTLPHGARCVPSCGGVHGECGHTGPSRFDAASERRSHLPRLALPSPSPARDRTGDDASERRFGHRSSAV